MNVVLTIIVNGEPIVTYRWFAVPSVGELINVDVNMPRYVKVKERLWYRNNNGDCAVDLVCEAIKVKAKVT